MDLVEVLLEMYHSSTYPNIWRRSSTANFMGGGSTTTVAAAVSVCSSATSTCSVGAGPAAGAEEGERSESEDICDG
jgi:hypothetical protein